MQPRPKKNPTDVIFLIESSPMVGVCYDLILENHIKPLMQFFYGMPITEELAISKDLRHTVFSAISYKGINSMPNSICSLINPNANARQFCEKIESSIDFWSQDEESHLAEGFAMALEIFEELDKKRDKLQIERHNQTRHIVLIASQKPYEDVPIFESKKYKGQKLDNILHNLSQFQVNLSIISPKCSIDWIKLFDRINANSCDVKLDKIGNFNYLILLQNSIHLIDYEAQQQKLHQQQLIQQQAQQAVQVTAQPPSVPSVQEQYQIAQDSVPSPAIAQQQLGYQQVSTQMAQSNLSHVQNIQGQQAQQSSQQQFIAQQKVIHQQTTQTGQSVSQIQQINQNFVTIPPAQQIQTQQEMFSQQQLQQQQIISQPSPGQPNLMPRSTSNIGKQMTGQQAPQQPQGVAVLSGQGPRPQIVQVQPIVRMGQPQGQQQVIMPGYEQMQQQQRFQTSVQQPQPQPQQQQYQQYQQAAQSQQGRVTKIWEGCVEWYQKVQNDKIQHSLKANLFAKNIMDSTNRQLVPEVPLAQAQTWPKKIPLQLLSRQIFEILNGFCQPPTRDLYLVTEGNNQELKQTLSSGAALINFASLNQEIKILIATVHNDQIICKIPSDQNKSLSFLKEIVKRQKQHQQLNQQPQRMPQSTQGLNPEMLQQGQLIIQPGQNNQIIGQVPPQNWLNQPQQQHSQQIYLQQQTQQQSQGQQQNYQQYPY